MSKTQHPRDDDSDDREDVLCSADEYRIPTALELRSLRIRCDLTLQDVEDAGVVSKVTLCRWEQEKRTPKISDAKKLLSFYREQADEQTQLDC